jgi:DNA repair protein RecO (recombination protein O)
LLKTVAKGARRPKSPFAGRLDLFFGCELEIHPAKEGDLHILKDLAVERPRLGLRRNYLQTLAASCFVKWIDLVAEDATPLPDLADLLDRGLDYLDANEADLRAVRHFERQLAEFLGVAEAGAEPHRCLARHFGGTPPQREELMGRFD